MKLLLLFVLFATSLSAQLNIAVPNSFPPCRAELTNIKPTISNYRGALVPNWYDYGFYSNMDAGSDENAPYLDEYLFPDSAYFKYPNGVGRGSNYKIANIIDPKAQLFKDYLDPEFGPSLPYNVDSIQLYFQYHRNTGDDIVDTLFVEIANDSALSTRTLVGNDIKMRYDVNQLKFKLLKFKATKGGVGEIDVPNKQTIAVLLTPDFATDTSFKGISALTLQPNLPRFKGGQNIIVALSFKPGFKYSIEDTITKMGNTYRGFSWEEQGLSTIPKYTVGEYNCSYWASYNNLLPLNPNWSYWYQTFIPSWSWPQNFPEHYWINVHTSYDDEWLSTTSNEVLLTEIPYPNPASATIILPYKVLKNQTIDIRVYDLVGKMVLQKQEGWKTNGSYLSQLNLSDLPSGLYFYALGNSSEMHKFVIQ